MEDVNAVMQKSKPNECIILFGDFTAHVDFDDNSWKNMIFRHNKFDRNAKEKYLSQLDCHNSLCIMNTLFYHRGRKIHLLNVLY